jgi:IS30 family transposase
MMRFVMGRPAISVEVQRQFWAQIRAGEIIDTAVVAVGVSKTVGWRWFREAGGVMPQQIPDRAAVSLRLTFAEREEIACRRAAGAGVREIARILRRSPSTVSRELLRGTRRPKTGYRATVAQALADARARRPKASLLRTRPRLGNYVVLQLQAKHSPEQISRRLPIDFPDDPPDACVPRDDLPVVVRAGQGCAEKRARHVPADRPRTTKAAPEAG